MSKLKLFGSVALLVLVVAGLSAVGAAETTELENKTVTFDNETNVSVSVQGADEIVDPENASVSVVFYNASEFDDDPATATAVLEDSISVEAGTEITVEYTEADGLEHDTDYRLVVEGNDSEVDSVSIEDLDDPWGGLADGSPGFGVAGAIGAIGVAAIVVVAVVSRREGGDL